MEKITWHLAQVNIGKMIGTNIDDPLMKDFVSQLDEVNDVAEKSEGFVWRLKTENNNATGIKAFEDDTILVNMSVWESIEDLERFVYSGHHLNVLKRRKEWFSRMKIYMALWYLPAGVVPTLEDAKKRLEAIEKNSASSFAFDFKKRFPAPTEVISFSE
jgi:hypothetical protein